MSQERARPDANNCFVCGPDNPIGLHLTFRMDGTVCRSEFTPDQCHVGFDGMTHGGILYSALDDAMANWLFLQGPADTPRGVRCAILNRWTLVSKCIWKDAWNVAKRGWQNWWHGPSGRTMAKPLLKHKLAL